MTTWLNRNRAEGINYPEAVRELRPQDFVQLGKDYLGFAQIHRRSGAPRFIDKMPNNFPNIGLLALILPNARIIDARRHPLDACLSCYRQLFAKGQAFTYDLTEIGEYYLQYQRMMDHWAQVLPGRVLTVQYEEVVTDFEIAGTPATGVLRSRLGGRVPAFLRERPAGAYAELGTGAAAHLRSFDRPLATLRPAPRRADHRDRADSRALSPLRDGSDLTGLGWHVVEDEVDAILLALVHHAVHFLIVDLVGVAHFELRRATVDHEAYA